jgi:hypothetical protein
MRTILVKVSGKIQEYVAGNLKHIWLRPTSEESLNYSKVIMDILFEKTPADIVNLMEQSSAAKLNI